MKIAAVISTILAAMFLIGFVEHMDAHPAGRLLDESKAYCRCHKGDRVQLPNF